MKVDRPQSATTLTSSSSSLSVLQACVGCKSPPVAPAPPYDVEIAEMELCSVLKTPEDGATSTTPKSTTAPCQAPESAMDQEESPREGDGPRSAMDQEESPREGGGPRSPKTQGNEQEMTAEDQEVTSQSEERKSAAESTAETDMTH